MRHPLAALALAGAFAANGAHAHHSFSAIYDQARDVALEGVVGRSQRRTLYLWKLVRPSDGLQYEQIGLTPYLRRR